jgi:soluble lytic murein transglycosylase-like protein
MSLNEAANKHDIDTSSWNLEKKEGVVVEATESMRKEILRERQIMRNAVAINEKKEIDNIVAFLESQAKKDVQPAKSNTTSKPGTATNNKKVKEIKNVKPSSTKEIAKAIAEQSTKSSNTIKGEDNKERKVIKIEMALVSDNLSKNAAIYKDYVEEYSKKFNIEQPLIYAVIEQESSFNPKARSWVPAFGLMQLVPRSGALDAYRYVYKKDCIPTQSYLYVPHQNIELGTAYLRVLMNQFAKVTNPDCRRLCVIASYNTGAGNVSRAFTGNTNIKKAIPLINNYSYDELYRHLSTRLSTSEARNYVTGVSKRREKYLK